MKILTASDSRKVAGSVQSLQRKWLSRWRRTDVSPERVMTRYYPYYFQSWKVTAPKSLGRTVKVIIFTGVNGMNRSVGPATEWPAGEQLEVDRDEVISPYTQEVEAEQLAQEYIEKFVMRRYRPSRTADIERERFELIYVPYYVYRREGQQIQKSTLIEGFTGAIGQLKDVPPVLQAIVSEKVVPVGEER